eukprot:4821018-Lingulodinium_polyedra.AAC.2
MFRTPPQDCGALHAVAHDLAALALVPRDELLPIQQHLTKVTVSMLRIRPPLRLDDRGQQRVRGLVAAGLILL